MHSTPQTFIEVGTSYPGIYRIRTSALSLISGIFPHARAFFHMYPPRTPLDHPPSSHTRSKRALARSNPPCTPLERADFSEEYARFAAHLVAATAIFDQLDTSGDEYLSQEELYKMVRQ
eukprot:1194648-Prorocentrum_minimum.AAC.1